MRKVSSLKKIAVLSCICMLLTMLYGCGESRVNLSKNMLVANETDVDVLSITMDVDDNSLDSPIELLDSPLAPNEARAITFSVPQKQAKKGTWSVLAITEDGEEFSSAFEIGEFNPHGDSADISCFSVFWNDEKEHYSVKVYLNGSEEDDGIYASDGEYNASDNHEPDDEDDSTDNTDDNDDGVSTQIPFILMDKDGLYYHQIDGDDPLSLKFADEGVYINSDAINTWCKCDIGGNTITLIKGSDDVAPMEWFEIQDLCTLVDDSGNIYAIDDSEGQELVINNFYFMDADYDSANFFFRPDGTVEVENDQGVQGSYTYEVDGYDLYIYIEGETFEFKIINKRILQGDDGTLLFRL